MNEHFFELPKEKQSRIINAGFEVFAQNDYKRASTDQIGCLAHISKGLLFHYFQNKKSFYLFLFDYACEQLIKYVVDENFKEHTDFFDLCEYAAQKKQEMLQDTPYLFDFLLRAHHSNKDEVSDELNVRLSEAITKMYDSYFQNIDTSKFKPDVSPEEILQMITLLSNGYILELQRTGSQIDRKEFWGKYQRWSLLLKKMAYKEEFIND